MKWQRLVGVVVAPASKPFAKMKNFYRIEHCRRKVGPYNSTAINKYGKFDFVTEIIKDELNIDLYNDKIHSTPYQDNLHHVFQGFEPRFGFRSIAQAKRWFGRRKCLYDFLKTQGFTFRKYKVLKRFDGKNQSATLKDYLGSWEKVPFEKLYK
jgi:hypothetical protein